MSRTNGQRTEDGKWKIEQCSVGPETAKRTVKRTKKSVGHALGQQRSGTLASASVCWPGTWHDKKQQLQ